MHASVRCFLTGGAAYNLVELLWRRKTHPSMFLAGGTCLALLDKALQGPLKGKSLFVKCAAGSGIITGVELLTGLVVNRWMGKEVWDYSDQKTTISRANLRFLFCYVVFSVHSCLRIMQGFKKRKTP